MNDSYDLTRMDPNSFEHLVNFLALKVLGAGATGFGPGSDGGRDGYFEGEAQYPSSSTRWNGVWYIQSKFHKPHLSKDPQKWLIEQVEEEIHNFAKDGSKRKWPNNWIIATNIDPSGVPETGAFDKIKELIAKARPGLENKFSIWGGRKILDLLAYNEDACKNYMDLLMPGSVLNALYQNISDSHANIKDVVHYLTVNQFDQYQHTRLEQAGSDEERPGIHKLFTDLPFFSQDSNLRGMGAAYLAHTMARSHQVDKIIPLGIDWQLWQRHPSRARIWFIKGGPGQGKSTLGQYLTQIHRAALILSDSSLPVLPSQMQLAEEIKDVSQRSNLWPVVPRIPVLIELKDFAKWFGKKTEEESRGIITFLSERITSKVQQDVLPGTLKRAFSKGRWMFVFDGLDEVPGDIKDLVADEVVEFTNITLVSVCSDAFIACTSRPQGYSGQFSALMSSNIELLKLSAEQALACAKPVLAIERSLEEAELSYDTLAHAIQSESIKELMTTPLQSHIMAIVVRSGGKPPERKWTLFTNFYKVIKNREAKRNLPNKELADILGNNEVLLKNLHNRLGFELHRRAERSKSDETALSREEVEDIVRETVDELQDRDVDKTIRIVMEATKERLVLVSTPKDADELKFDIRPLQEFFAAEYIYESVDAPIFSQRLKVIAGDSHWREVMHFLLSALIESKRQTETLLAIASLQDLNGNNDEGNIRYLKRELGLGGVIAARLLVEGVLDQDRRIRLSLTNSLEPLLCSTEAPKFLSEVRRRHSLDWLCEVAYEHLRERSDEESVGAAAILLLLLPDLNENVSNVIEILSKKERYFISSVFNVVEDNLGGLEFSEYINNQYEDTSIMPMWAVKFVINQLIRSDWYKLGHDSISRTISILTEAKKLIPRAARLIGFSEEMSDKIQLLLTYNNMQNYNGDDEQTDIIRFGAIEICYGGVNHEFDISSWSETIRYEAEKTTGILRAIWLVLSLPKNLLLSDVNLLLDTTGNNPKIINMLDSAITSYIPKSTEELFSCKTEDSVVNIYSDDIYAGRFVELKISGDNATTTDDWKQLFIKQTSLGVFYICNHNETLAASFAEFAQCNDAEDIVRLACCNAPDFLLSNVARWGRIIQKYSDTKIPMRNIILEISSNPIIGTRYHGPVSTFELNLPIENVLLPHILVMIINATLYDRYSVFKSTAELKPELHNMMSSYVKKFVPDVNNLITLSNSILKYTDTLAAVLIMSLIHPDIDYKTRKSMELRLNTELKSDNYTYFLNEAVFALLSFEKYMDHESENIAGSLLKMTKGNYKARKGLESVITIVRQRTNAPIYNSGNMDIWYSEKKKKALKPAVINIR